MFIFQQQVPLPLPCYDFTLVTNPPLLTASRTFVHKSNDLAQENLWEKNRVHKSISGKTDFQGVTGGVYKIWVLIHRGVLIHDY